MTLGGAAQVAAAHCPNERTYPATLWPSPRNVLQQRLTTRSRPDTNCYSFTYPGGMEGWVGL